MEEKNFSVENSENKSAKELEKEHIRAERYKEKAAHSRDKKRRKAEIRAQRAAVKNERRRLNEERKQQNGKSAGTKRGLVAAVITLGISTAVLGSLLAYSNSMAAPRDGALETGYRKSFYDTVVQVDNMDLNLSKALSTKDGGAMQLYLLDLAVNSELAENNLQQLPIEDQNKFYTTKIINQVGDYAKYLNKKIIKGESLSEKDYENLKNLYKANVALKDALQAAMRDMQSDFDFTEIGKNAEGNKVLQNFDELQEMSVEFPELIYDGPFSDGKDNGEIKGLSGESITSAEAESIFSENFSEYAPENIRCSGKGTGEIETFCVEAEINGDMAYAQISVVGGKTVMYSYAGSCNDINYGEDYAIQKAREFIGKEIAGDIEPVWINLSNNLYTINFAPKVSGAIIYPDLIKVRVCAETGMIIGLEATGYYKNHTERVIEAPVLTTSKAREKVSGEIAVETARLAVVPTGKNSERLCYEFSGTRDGDIYYVYIDAENGRQVEMFKVIDSEEGALLM